MSILSTIMGVETSGGHNIVQGNIGDINNQTGDLAKGYFQITNATWAQFGGLNTGYTAANQAPYATQLQIAQNIPVARWGPNTQSALQSAGYSPTRGQTLGQLMAANNEDGTETVAADGSSLTGSGSTLANGVPDQSSGGNPNTTDPLGSSVTVAGRPNATGSTTTADQGQGTPVTQGLQQGTINAVTGWIGGIESAMGGAFKGAVTAAETATATWLGSVQNWFSRAGLIFLGIVLIAIALTVIMWDHGGKETVVAMGKAAAA